MTPHEKKNKAAEDAIDVIFSDTTVSQKRTYEDLRDLQDSIEMKLDCLRRDLRRQEREEAARGSVKG